MLFDRKKKTEIKNDAQRVITDASIISNFPQKINRFVDCEKTSVEKNYVMYYNTVDIPGGDKMPKDNKKNKKSVKAKQGANYNPIASSVRRLYNKSAPLLLCEALLFVVVAGMMLVWPVAVLTTLTFVIGVALILFGLYRTIAGFVVSRDVGGGWFDVVFGLVNVVLGVLFCIYPVGSVISLVYIFVALFMLRALLSLIFSINMVRARFGHYWVDLIVSLLLIALAIVLMVYPMAGAIAMVFYLAVMLILYAVADIYMYLEIRRLKKLVSD